MNSRDGARRSLWQSTTTQYNPASVLSKKKYDVAIAGGGISGITLALLLQLSGKKCIVMEAQTIGFGTTGGSTAHLNTLLDTPYNTIIKNFGKEKARLVSSVVREAIQLVKDNIRQFDIDCGFEETPAFLFSQNVEQEKELDKIFESCNEVGVEAEYSPTIPVPVSFTKAMKVAQQGKFHPLRYLHALASAFERSGGIILHHCRVTNSESDSNNKEIVHIATTVGDFQANALVYATHIPTGINILHLRCPAYRSYAMAVRLEDDAYPEGLAYDMYDPYHYYRTQEIDGKKYLIVGGDDHKTGDEPNTNGCFLKLEAHVRTHFNVAEIADQWSSQYFEPVDGLPYIGHLPGNPDNVYVATGYGGNGITYSHVAALILSRMILGQQDVYNELFTPGRVKPVAAFTDFIKHNADVVKQFSGKWFKHEKLAEAASLAPGEGKVVKFENEILALYKDEQGALHAVNPACTHMKCSVTWNAGEKSWDCPCHGARYSYDGQVLNGPANKDLESVEIRALIKEEKNDEFQMTNDE